MRRILGFTLIVIAASLQASATFNESDCRENIRVFLSHPGKIEMNALSQSGITDCWTLIGSSNANTDRLNYWVKHGNQWAARYLAEHLKQLDGGNLEDSLIALGVFSDHDMHQILIFANEGLLSDQQLLDVLTMLPLSTSDDAQRQLEILKARRKSVVQVSERRLERQRVEALKAIDSFILEIQSKNPSYR